MKWMKRMKRMKPGARFLSVLIGVAVLAGPAAAATDRALEGRLRVLEESVRGLKFPPPARETRDGLARQIRALRLEMNRLRTEVRLLRRRLEALER